MNGEIPGGKEEQEAAKNFSWVEKIKRKFQGKKELSSEEKSRIEDKKMYAKSLEEEKKFGNLMEKARKDNREWAGMTNKDRHDYIDRTGNTKNNEGLSEFENNIATEEEKEYIKWRKEYFQFRLSEERGLANQGSSSQIAENKRREKIGEIELEKLKGKISRDRREAIDELLNIAGYSIR